MKWWKRLFGGWSRDSLDHSPKRLIDIPEFREPSPNLLRQLRALDHRAEVVYAGQGVWYVGRVKPESPRRILARREILSLRVEDGFPDVGRLPELRQAILKEQGFGLVVWTDGKEGRPKPIYGEPDAILVKEFEMAMFVERGGVIETEEDLLAKAVASSARSQAQWDKDAVNESYFEGRGNFHFAASSPNQVR